MGGANELKELMWRSCQSVISAALEMLSPQRAPKGSWTSQTLLHSLNRSVASVRLALAALWPLCVCSLDVEHGGTGGGVSWRFSGEGDQQWVVDVLVVGVSALFQHLEDTQEGKDLHKEHR